MPFKTVLSVASHWAPALPHHNRQSRLALVLATLGLSSVLSCANPAPADARAAACSERKGVLGVSRVIEIDGANGPQFGHVQYRKIDFLKPGEVVLTFDDGPLRKNTLKVLNALERHCTKATFFMVGRMAVSDPEMVKEIDRRGHTVGTHTWSHKNLGRLSKTRATREIELGVSAISAALGKPAAPFFRFPYLSDPQRMIDHLKDRDTAIFSIDIDSVDFRTRSGSVIVQRIMKGLKKRGKGILLFHDIQKSTARGLDTLLDRLHDGGYKVVHIVPKAPTTTLARFDTDGMKELIRRKKRLGERPLAKRSIVWPISLDGLPPVEALKPLPRPFVRSPGKIAPREAVPPGRLPPSFRKRIRTTAASGNAVESQDDAAQSNAQSGSSAQPTTYAQGAAPSLRPSRDWRDDAFGSDF